MVQKKQPPSNSSRNLLCKDKRGRLRPLLHFLPRRPWAKNPFHWSFVFSPRAVIICLSSSPTACKCLHHYPPTQTTARIKGSNILMLPLPETFIIKTVCWETKEQGWTGYTILLSFNYYTEDRIQCLDAHYTRVQLASFLFVSWMGILVHITL